MSEPFKTYVDASQGQVRFYGDERNYVLWRIQMSVEKPSPTKDTVAVVCVGDLEVNMTGDGLFSIAQSDPHILAAAGKREFTSLAEIVEYSKWLAPRILNLLEKKGQ